MTNQNHMSPAAARQFLESDEVQALRFQGDVKKLRQHADTFRMAYEALMTEEDTNEELLEMARHLMIRSRSSIKALLIREDNLAERLAA